VVALTPKRYRDIAPEPPAALPPAQSQITSEGSRAEQGAPPDRSPTHLSQAKKLLKSVCNVFGLFRQYHATHFPAHDPDENISPDDLIEISSNVRPNPDYHLYPNESSFLLGEWYWNDGDKKSQSSFQHLLKIVRHPDFHPGDVAGTNW